MELSVVNQKYYCYVIWGYYTLILHFRNASDGCV